MLVRMPGDKWGQAKKDAREGGEKLADAAQEAADALGTKARSSVNRTGDQVRSTVTLGCSL